MIFEIIKTNNRLFLNNSISNSVQNVKILIMTSEKKTVDVAFFGNFVKVETEWIRFNLFDMKFMLATQTH